MKSTADLGFYLTQTLRSFAEEQKCWWLIDLIHIAVRFTPACRNERTFWKLAMVEDLATKETHWLVVATDGGKLGNPEVTLYKQKIEHSDIDPDVLPLTVYCFPEPELQGEHYLLMLPEDY